jgi:hypothetical protein
MSSATAQQTITLDGSYALETNVSAHSGDAKTYRVFLDWITDVKRRIVKREGRGNTLGSVAGTEIQSLHEFTHVNPVSGAETYHILGAIDGGGYIYKWDGVSTWNAQTLPITPTAGGVWGFATIGSPSALLAFNGKDQLLIARQAAATVATLTSVGTTATATSPTPHPFVTGETVNHAGASPAAYNGDYVVTVTSPTTWTYTFAGGTSPATAPNGTIRAETAKLVWRLAGQAAPTFAATYDLTSNDDDVNSTGTGTTVSITKGSKIVNNSGTSFAPGLVGGAWNNDRIEINSIPYTIASVGTSSQLTLTEEVREETASGLSWTVYPGVGNWDVGPQYTWAYYNEDTGHCSNPAPILQVTERNQFGRTITLTIPGSSENLAAWNNGYRKIRIFRTAKNAGVPVAINELTANVNSAVTAITYIETATKFADTYLTFIVAPSLNRPPPVGIASVVYHQGRGWLMVPREGKLYFTPLQVEMPIGVAIESVPLFYQRDMGGMRGLFLVGGASSADSLIIQTSHGDFSVDGFSSTTFALYRLPTRDSGSYFGAGTSVGRSLVEFYADKRLMAGPDNDLARVVQDRLTLVRDSLISKVRLHWFSARNYNLLILSIPSGPASTANDYTYVFDLDRPDDRGGYAVYEWGFGISAMATVHNSATKALELFIGNSAGAIFRLFSSTYQDAGANYVPVLKTSLLRFPEGKWKIKFINIYLDDTGAALTWTGRLFINEQTNPAATDGTSTALAFRVPDYRTQSAQGRKHTVDFTKSTRTEAEVFQIEITGPTSAAVYAIEKIVIGYDSVTSVPKKS